MITKDDTYKILDNATLISGKNRFFQMMNKNSSKLYASPILFQELQRNNLKPRHDQCKSDVYSMGMTLVHAATLQPVSDCYDHLRNTIDQKVLNAKLMSVSRKYSVEFGSFLKEILAFKEAERPNFLSLLTRLSVNQEDNQQQYSVVVENVSAKPQVQHEVASAVVAKLPEVNSDLAAMKPSPYPPYSPAPVQAVQSPVQRAPI